MTFHLFQGSGGWSSFVRLFGSWTFFFCEFNSNDCETSRVYDNNLSGCKPACRRVGFYIWLSHEYIRPKKFYFIASTLSRLLFQDNILNLHVNVFGWHSLYFHAVELICTISHSTKPGSTATRTWYETFVSDRYIIDIGPRLLAMRNIA